MTYKNKAQPQKPESKPEPPEVRFVAFFLAWADRMKWVVPAIHIRACIWLATRGDLAVFRCFRGFSKSTILAIYNAWMYYENQEYRILHQGDQDKTAFKTSRDTKRVLQKHPFTQKLMQDIRGEASFWWTPSAEDERNPSMQASGIMSNITSSRADEVQNDDVEVPKNIKTTDAREQLRYRLGEQTHILVPEGKKLFVGTPHTHDSLYDEMEAMGADCLTIKMFEKEHRIENVEQKKSYKLPFEPEFIFNGIGKNARVLTADDYQIIGNLIYFNQSVVGLIDFYAGSAWPERFHAKEMLKRRQQTRTINEWDSQYQLHSKPINQVRLDPASIIPYDLEPQVKIINGTLTLWIGKVQVVSVSARLDPSAAKMNSDVCSFSVIFSDDAGRLYWHVAKALEGELAEFDNAGKVIGGQVWQLCDIIQKYQIPRVTIETNGIGGHVPAILRGALKARNLTSAVIDKHTSTNKNALILQAFEPPMSSRYLWAHIDVLETIWDEMKDWNPSVKSQPDDHLNSGAMAIMDEPIRVGKVIGRFEQTIREDWRPHSAVYEV